MAVDVLGAALAGGQRTLSEYQSKQLLSSYGIPVTRETLAHTAEDAAAAAAELGFPVALKGCAPEITHKTELALVELGIGAEREALETAGRLLARAPAVLVQEMVAGSRTLMVGMVRDAQFGPCVSVGLGGIFAEVLRDSALRVAPFDQAQALQMLQETKAYALLHDFRRMPDVDTDALASTLVALGTLALEHTEVTEIDINPVIITGNGFVAVDALVVLDRSAPGPY